jgi:predicted acyltransferase
MTSDVNAAPVSEQRLLSLDLFRGLTMFLLIAEGARLFGVMTDVAFDGTVIGFIGTQFHHHPWNGLRFWDLIQPFFMFIVGVALPLSVAQREKRGDSYSKILRHVLVRSLVLLLLGWGLYCIGPGKIVFRFQNVLAQLSVTYLIAFLVMRRAWWFQIGCSLGILLATDLAYRYCSIDGYDQPFTQDQNLGAYVDMLISDELSGGHWVSLNAIPTAAHTIWGVLAGQLLMSGATSRRKLMILFGAGISALAIGYGLDPVTPIIKRIATASFVLSSGGWCLIALAMAYWWVDVLKFRRGVTFFAIVGMNPLFIYLFAEVGGSGLIHRIVKPFSMAAFGWAGDLYAQMLTGCLVWALLWGICYWLYRNRIFIRI